MANENGKLNQEQQQLSDGFNNQSADGRKCLNETTTNMCDNEPAEGATSLSFAEGTKVNCNTTKDTNTDTDDKQNEAIKAAQAPSVSLAASSTVTLTSVTSEHMTGPLSESSSSTSTSSSSSSATATAQLQMSRDSARGQLTDLVADVCFNGARSSSTSSDNVTAVGNNMLPVGFGDCTNIRATVDVLDLSEESNIHKTDLKLDSQCTASSNSNVATNSIQQPTAASPSPSPSPAIHVPTAPTQNSSTFSFKHFLSSSSTPFTAPSTTVTSLDPICSVASSAAAAALSSSSSSLASTMSTATGTTTTISTFNGSTQNYTGARPKIPQSTGHAIEAIGSERDRNPAGSASLSNNGGGGGGGGESCGDGPGLCNVGGTRMKRSPRFSSFDSQASLAEYTTTGQPANIGGGDEFSLFSGTTCNSSGGFRLYSLSGTENLSSACGGPTASSSSSISKRNANSAATCSAQMTGFPSSDTSTINHNCSSIVVGAPPVIDQRHQRQHQQQHQHQHQQQYVPRSYSNYEMPLPPPISPSPRRRMADAVANVAAAAAASSPAPAPPSILNRPNRLSLHPTNASKLKLDLPIDTAAAAANIVTGHTSDFPVASASSVLPDFVQDHWMDTLYLHDMHLNSPRSSPTRDFVKATASAVWCNMGAEGGACGGNNSVNASGSGSGSGNAAASIGGTGSGSGSGGGGLTTASRDFCSQETTKILNSLPLGNGSGNGNTVGGGNSGNGNGVGVGCASSSAASSGGGGIPNVAQSHNNNNNVPNSNSASKMLPDFLSDGPIIHSSQRLADVAAGLPSNSIGSPEDSSTMTSQLSKLHMEVERLQRELSETRTALCEQTRRANDLERQLQEENRRRTTTTSTAQQVLRLKQQLAEMAEDAELLRRENETLREDGAVGGYSDNAPSQRPDNRYVRPATTRSQQISQALLRAASNAENNLRQLLAGVDNLRQMAADIEDPALRLDYGDGNSDVFPEFVDDFDGFEDFSGGPAL